jgi:hypothetical protein
LSRVPTAPTFRALSARVLSFSGAHRANPQGVLVRGEAGATDRSITMPIPHFINDDRSEMRGIKPGWYGIDDDGNLSAGPFSSREQCLISVAQSTNDPTPSTLSPRVK